MESGTVLLILNRSNVSNSVLNTFYIILHPGFQQGVKILAKN
jgi:hypothetical protein